MREVLFFSGYELHAIEVSFQGLTEDDRTEIDLSPRLRELKDVEDMKRRSKNGSED